MDPSAASHQLRLRHHLNLVNDVRRANRVTYSLHDEHVGVLSAEAVYHVTHVRIDELNRSMEAVAEAEPPCTHRTPKRHAVRDDVRRDACSAQLGAQCSCATNA
jgi:hypothetical protein